jgi:acetyl esterase/lipase
MPAVDTELAAALASVRAERPATVTLEMLPALRARIAEVAAPVERLATDFGVDIDVVPAPGADGDPDVPLLCARPRVTAGHGGVLYWIHGGGGVVGDFRFGLELILACAIELGLPVVSVDYRLAPMHPDPAALKDCVAGLRWLAAHVGELDADAQRIVIAGHSAGAGLAAGATLFAKESGDVAIAAQMLLSPMLDDRATTPSSTELDGEGLWDGPTNLMAWRARLGARQGGPDVSAYTAPARAVDLSGLPPAFVDVGSVDTFRDEAIAYASRIWHAGGAAELHVWPGAHHAFETVAPDSWIARRAQDARRAWLARLTERWSA